MKKNDLTILESKAIALIKDETKIDEAIQVNKEILMIDPCNISALNRIAKCYLKKDLLEDALKCYKKVIEIDNKNRVAENALLDIWGLFYNVKLGDYQTLSELRKKEYNRKCYSCDYRVSSKNKRCKICGWYICKNCGSCGCGYNGN